MPRFEIEGPTDSPYDGSICLPQVPLPEGSEVEVGEHATIQIVEAAVHGAAMYSVSRNAPLPTRAVKMSYTKGESLTYPKYSALISRSRI